MAYKGQQKIQSCKFITRWPCRCNERNCRARVTRKKHPDDYTVEKYKRCPRYPNCKGVLYVDYFRMQKCNDEKDHGVVCADDCLPYKHRTNNHQCKQHSEYILDRQFNPKPKHSPLKNEEQIEAPF